MAMFLQGVIVLLAIVPFLALCQEPSTFNSHLLPRPLILEYQAADDGAGAQTTARKESEEAELRVLECTSWRVAGEANNLSPWKRVPEECASYVKDYVTGNGYGFDLERVYREAGAYAKGVVLGGDGKDAWVFDVDETLLSHLPYYADHGYGLELFDPVEFDKWVDKAVSPAIESSLRLYKELLDLGFKVFFLTGRNEKQRKVTEENLMSAGFQKWDKLILRATDDHGKLAIIYKSEKRSEMVKEGYRILGNSGDQWSDLLGSEMSIRSFKLPNPMYYIP